MHRFDTKNEKSQNEYTALALYKWTDKLVDHREILLTDQQQHMFLVKFPPRFQFTPLNNRTQKIDQPQK